MDKRADRNDGAGAPRERLGGARADFVANLGRRVAELHAALRLLEADPGSPRISGELQRRMHALAASARLLRFTKLAESLAASEALVQEVAERGGELSIAFLSELRVTFDGLPEVAWAQASLMNDTPPPGAVGPKNAPNGRALDPVRVPLPASSGASVPQSALVVGPAQLADALGLSIDAPLDQGDATFEVERTDDNTTAIDLARALAPDIIVVDVDRVAAKMLVEALVSDPMIEQVPVLVVGTFARAEDAAPFVAMGVARALAKPVSPDALRRAAAEITATYVRQETSRSPLGETTLDALGEKLAEELRRGLCDAALSKSRGVSFDLGEGSDVLAALWGAVARIRDLVTIHSSGDVRFSASGPEGALPLAPWLGEPERSAADPLVRADVQNANARGRLLPGARSGELGDVQGKTIVVADDDAAITWFLAGVLRAAGATVVEAHDGQRALEAAFRHAPDLVISDVLMPIVDGFGLCRALRRDLVLRDVPVILLSWKEDLLQRVRELGADADGYLKKEASAVAIVQRVREVLRGRQRVAERIAAGGEVRGRLEGLTTRTLLSVVCAHRPDSTLEVRDACFLYDVAIRGGAPVRATRTAPDGNFQRGSAVLAALLGVGAGRFVVSSNDREALSVRPDLGGTLAQQLLGPIATARAAQRLLSGASLVSIERVEIDSDRMAAYADASPEPARSLLQTIGAGASPRALITSGQAAPRLVEDVLCDAAARGAVVGVFDGHGDDVLFDAATREAAILRGERNREPVVIPPLDLGPVIGTATPGPVALVADGPQWLEHAAPEPLPAPVVVVQVVKPRLELVAEPPPVATFEAASPFAPHAPPIVTLGSLTPPPAMPEPAPRRLSPPAPPIAPDVVTETPSRAIHARRRPSMYAPHVDEAAQPPPKKKDSRAMWILFAVAGIVFAVGARLSRERQDVPQTPAAETPAQAAAPALPSDQTAPAPTSTEASGGEGTTKSSPILPQEAALKPGDNVPQGQGMLEVVAGSNDTVYIGGTLVGNGPVVRRALAPRKEPYEIRVVLRGEERVRFVAIQPGRLSRVRIAPPWQR